VFLNEWNWQRNEIVGRSASPGHGRASSSFVK
jgi:hypothetical protein